MKYSKLVILVFGICLLNLMGCARVKVEAPKEPIKVDISMRLDIYQHVEKEINAIEDIVSGSDEKPKAKDDHSLLGYFVNSAYAQENLSPEVEQAALRRKDRRAELTSLESKGAVGEDKSGLVVLMSKDDLVADKLVKQENSDRMIIYESIARKNGTSVEDVQKLYAKRLQKDAPAGTPIEVLNESTGNYAWQPK